MARLKRSFTSEVKRGLIPSLSGALDNQGMLDPKKLASRLVEAMDKANPPVSSTRLAKACHVTPQAVNGWRNDGKIAKQHLPIIARETGRPLEYFMIVDEARSVRESRSSYEDRHLRIVIAEWEALMPEEQQLIRDEVVKKADHNRAVAARMGNPTQQTILVAEPRASYNREEQQQPEASLGRQVLQIFRPRKKPR